MTKKIFSMLPYLASDQWLFLEGDELEFYRCALSFIKILKGDSNCGVSEFNGYSIGEGFLY